MLTESSSTTSDVGDTGGSVTVDGSGVAVGVGVIATVDVATAALLVVGACPGSSSSSLPPQAAIRSELTSSVSTTQRLARRYDDLGDDDNIRVSLPCLCATNVSDGRRPHGRVHKYSLARLPAVMSCEREPLLRVWGMNVCRAFVRLVSDRGRNDVCCCPTSRDQVVTVTIVAVLVVWSMSSSGASTAGAASSALRGMPLSLAFRMA